MTAIIFSKIAVMSLIVASPALTIVRHVHRITINVWRCDSKCHWQSTCKLLRLSTRNSFKFVVSNNLLVAVKKLHIEAIDRCVYARSFILLVLPDMYAAPAAVVGSAVGFRDVFVTRTLHALLFGWHESTYCTETIVCIHRAQAAFTLEKAASKIDKDIDTVCMNWVLISDECCKKRGGNSKGDIMGDRLGGQLKAAATEFYFLALH
jgi:hypothetical protein